ncbi:unnamed protein product, partial [Polarella glacialis]
SWMQTTVAALVCTSFTALCGCDSTWTTRSLPRRARLRRARDGEDLRVGAAVAATSALVAMPELAALCFLPEVLVFDLDDTLWEGDVDMTSGPPFRPEGGSDGLVTARDGDSLRMFQHAEEIFSWIEASGLRAAVASHTSQGPWAEVLLATLKTERGTSYSSIAAIKEMHRAETVANRSKAVHLRKIAQRAGCELHDMVFFDNMSHNVEDGESVHVTSCFTPQGLTWAKFLQCLQDFDSRALARATRSEAAG